MRRQERVGGVGSRVAFSNIASRLSIKSPSLENQTKQTSLEESGNSSLSEKRKQRIKRAATLVLRGGRPRDHENFEPGSPRGRTSTFYTEDEKGVDVTTVFVRPVQEMVALNLNKKSSYEMVQLLGKEIDQLNNMVMPMSTGAASVNMMVS